LPSRIAGTIFPGVAEPLTGAAVLPFDVFAEALPTKDFFAIAMVNLLFDFRPESVDQRRAGTSLRN
jgi:hypothetical protein